MLYIRTFIVFIIAAYTLFYTQASTCLELYSSTKNFPYSSQDTAFLREQVLKSPDKLLLENTQFIDENTSLEITQYAKNYPFIGYLSECLSPICPLNRTKKPIYREKLDDYAAQLLFNYSKQGSKKVSYLSYASGELFSDLVIAAKALNKGVKQLDIHLIEPTYALYKTATQELLTSYYAHCLSSKKALLTELLKSPHAVASCLVKKYTPSFITQRAKQFERFDIAQELTEDKLLKNPALIQFFTDQKSNPAVVARTLEYQNEQFKQFLEFFAYAYPQARVRLFLYSSPDDYISSSQAQTLDMAILADPEQKDQVALSESFKKLANMRLKIGGKALLLTKPPAISTYLKGSEELSLESLSANS